MVGFLIISFLVMIVVMDLFILSIKFSLYMNVIYSKDESSNVWKL